MSVFVLQLPRRPESVPEAREFVHSAAVDSDLPENRTADLLIAVSEACSNVVAHADGSAQMRVEVHTDDERLKIVVADDGQGFVVNGHLEMPAPDAAGGRGLALMELLCDDVAVETSDHGTRITLEMTARADDLASS